MKGVILAGGKGTRLAPITDDYPKQLVPVLGKPILFYSIEYLLNADIKEIAIVVSPETGAMIEEVVGRRKFKANISFIYQDEPRGLAHAIGITRDFIGTTEHFITLLGDNLFDKPLSDLIETFYETKADTLLLLKQVDRAYAFGVVAFDESGKAQKLVEKPKTFVSDYAIVGVYIFSNKIFDAIRNIKASARGELEITDAIASQVELGQEVQTSILHSYWFDSGTRDGLLNANKCMLLAARKFDSINADVEKSYLLGNIALSENTSISNSNLMGPIFIGNNVKISNSVIGPFTSIADNCVIDNSELQETIIMDSTKIRGTCIVSSVVYKDRFIKDEPMMINTLKK